MPLTSSWGTTETSPAATTAHFPDLPTGCIGVPYPGVTVKLAPVQDKLEIRVRGANVTPGYYRDPELTAATFDEEGFYRSGDAVKLIDEHDPNRGMVFDGRIAENFKLLTGTWVAAGTLRTRLLSAAGVLSDAVICGHDAAYVAALAWVNPAEARDLGGAELRGTWRRPWPASTRAPARPRGSSAYCCSSNRRASTPARSPTRAT